MLTLLRSLTAPLLSLLFLMMGSGLFNTFVSIRLEIEGVDPKTIGAVTAALYLGILLGSLWIGRWIAKTGHIRSFIILAAILTVLVLFQSLWMNPWYWSFLRLLGGMCSAGVFIIIESWLLMQAPSSLRSVALSIYLAILYAALSSGQLLIDLSDIRGILPYCTTALLVALSIFPLSMTKISGPKAAEVQKHLNIAQLFRISPFGFIGGVISGMILATTFGLIPVYAKEMGMSLSEIGIFMATLVFGGFSLQWPIGIWAAKSSRKRVICITSFATFCLAVVLATIQTNSFPLLLCLAWLFGGFSFTLYPLSMAYVCEMVQETDLVAVTGGFVLSYGIGSISGPLIAPFAMGAIGAPGLFYFFSIITLFLALIGLKKPAAAIVDK